MATAGRERPAVYTDEDAGRSLAEALRVRRFDILTAAQAGLLGASDERQLEHAAGLGRVLLSFNRRDFRRLHTRWRAEGREHGGIVLLPQFGPVERRAVRAALLLDWLAAERAASRLVSWGDLQPRLHGGERLVGYTAEEVRLALGLA